MMTSFVSCRVFTTTHGVLTPIIYIVCCWNQLAPNWEIKQNKPGAGAVGSVANSTTSLRQMAELSAGITIILRAVTCKTVISNTFAIRKLMVRLVGRTIPTTSMWVELTPPLGLVGSLCDRRFPVR